MRCLRSILRVKWQDRIPNTEVLRRTKLSGMEAMLMNRQLRWCGHLVRMNDSRLPKAVFYSELKEGNRKSGGQFLRYRDVLKRHLNACNLRSDHWEDLVRQRQQWRNAVNKAIGSFEERRLKDLDDKRLAKKNQPRPSYTYTYNSSGQLYCALCNRTF
ncbi:uncharacterized protein [Epargyreus clarus]|uniref:uncharacterized protein n=1 Tax=Epargyreus clarus TaxID=520877 RepID=UPI003C2FEE5F